jgi:hypothetical protein
VLIWFDNLLVYAQHFGKLPEIVQKVFERLEKLKIELNPLKPDLCALIITW